MTKLRVTCVQTREFDINPAYYPEGWTLEQMMAAEKTSCETEPAFYMETGEMSVLVEVINE